MVLKPDTLEAMEHKLLELVNSISVENFDSFALGKTNAISVLMTAIETGSAPVRGHFPLTASEAAQMVNSHSG